MHERLLLFDIDGTILRAGGAGFRSMARATRELYNREFDWQEIDPRGGLDPLLFQAAATKNGVDPTDEEHERFRDLYVRYLPEELARHPERLKVMPGIHDLLRQLREHAHVRLGLLTGNYRDSARLKLEAAGIQWEWFVVGAFGDEAPTRPELVPCALDRFASSFGQPIPTDRVLIVGDTPRDIECALVNDCQVVAVGTGDHELHELHAAGAHLVLEDLSDPTPLLELIV